MLQRWLQLCYVCIYGLTTYGSLCIFLTCLISGSSSWWNFHHQKLCPFPHRKSSLVLCFIPQAGKNGVVNEDRKCRDQKPGLAFLSCYDFSCFHGHVCFSPFYSWQGILKINTLQILQVATKQLYYRGISDCFFLQPTLQVGRFLLMGDCFGSPLSTPKT